MGQADFWAEGDWNATCAMCGRKRKASTMVQNEVSKLYRCVEHNEPRHPQDYVGSIPSRPTTPPTFIQKSGDRNVGPLADQE